MKSDGSPATPVTGPRITVMKSRFVGALIPVADEQDARARVKAMKIADRKARHIAFAFRVAGEPVIEGMSDDGEPRATAGLPILQLLRHHDLTGVLVTVARYYGGIKLGPGNLRRAYAEAAKAVIEGQDAVSPDQRRR